ncbi:toll/interleukin-1 receptor domain-containing protein [Nostoc sp. C110]|uniref:toll/interleukin-1 receptor domain-containing protein n=1 Tax=Nostoc sp. C110 TaxID=3349876 RepID=UPI00370D1053
MNARNPEVCLLSSEADKAIANLLTDALNYYSIDIWQPKDISIGSKTISETRTALDKAKFVIVLLSNNFVKSSLFIELAVDAKRNNKVLIPVLIENIRIPGEFLDIQSANLINWDGNRESEQIVQLWKLIQQQFLKYPSKKIGFNNNQLIAIIGLILTGMGVLVAIVTPEIRCKLKLQQCPDKSSIEKTGQSSEVTLRSKDVSNSPVPIQTTSPLEPTIVDPLPDTTSIQPISTPQPPIVNPLPDITPIPTIKNKASSEQNFDIEQVNFKLQSCKHSNQNVKCNLLIENTGNEKTLTLYAIHLNKISRLFDLAGNEYTAESVEIGISKSSRYHGFARTELIQNSKIQSSISFVGIPSQLNEIKILEIKTNLSRNVQFRDILLSK